MCFSAAWAMQLCIYIVVAIAFISILRIVIPWLVSWAGLPSPVVQIINIVIWAIVCIIVIYIIFDLLGCMFYGGSLRIH